MMMMIVSTSVRFYAKNRFPKLIHFISHARSLKGGFALSYHAVSRWWLANEQEAKQVRDLYFDGFSFFANYLSFLQFQTATLRYDVHCVFRQ